MTGLEKIIQKILDDTKAATQQTISAAEIEAAAIEEEAQKSAAQQAKETSRSADEAVEESAKRAQSAAELLKRQKILQAKQEIIYDVIEKAHQTLNALPNDAYFDVIVKLTAKAALPQRGDIIFSLKDRERLPVNLEQRLKEAVKAKGGSLEISDETRDIDGGFVLIYGGIEENCSFNALFEAERERLIDRVHELLFR